MAEPSPLTIPTGRQQKSFGGGTSKKHPRQGPKPAVQNLPGTTAEPGKVRKREIRCGPCSEKTGDQKHRHNPSNAGCPSWRSSSGGCNARIGRVITEGAHYHSSPTAKIACKGDRDPCADGDQERTVHRHPMDRRYALAPGTLPRSPRLAPSFPACVSGVVDFRSGDENSESMPMGRNRIAKRHAWIWPDRAASEQLPFLTLPRLPLYPKSCSLRYLRHLACFRGMGWQD